MGPLFFRSDVKIVIVTSDVKIAGPLFLRRTYTSDVTITILTSDVYVGRNNNYFYVGRIRRTYTSDVTITIVTSDVKIGT